MPISFSSGLITRGYGAVHRILTRGFGTKFDSGGIGPGARTHRASYDLKINTEIIKTSSGELKLYSPVDMRTSEEVLISTIVNKEVSDDVNVFGYIDHSSLFDILDEI